MKAGILWSATVYYADWTQYYMPQVHKTVIPEINTVTYEQSTLPYYSFDDDLTAVNMRKIPVMYSNSLSFHSSGLYSFQMYKQNIKNPTSC
jgi:hypothetical protein